MRPLYNMNTGEELPRMKELREGATPTLDEIQTLWKVFADGCEYTGVPKTVQNFGEWIADGYEITW